MPKVSTTGTKSKAATPKAATDKKVTVTAASSQSATTKSASKASAKEKEVTVKKTAPVKKDVKKESTAVTKTVAKTASSTAHKKEEVAAKSTPKATAKAATKSSVKKDSPEKNIESKAAGAEAKDDSKQELKKSVSAPKPKSETPSSAPKKVAVVVKPMSKAAIAKDPFLSKQRELLEAERAEYVGQAKQLRAEADQMAEEMEPGDTQFDEESGEGGTANVDREHNLRLVSQAIQTVEEIDHAMEKMAKGTYGLCEHCGKPIAEARLEALPFAALCVACKSGGLVARR